MKVLLSIAWSWLARSPKMAMGLWAVGCGVVAAGSLMPVGVATVGAGLDKAVHALAYGALAFLPVVFLTRARSVAGMTLALIVYGAMLEAAQLMVPGREFSYADMTANAAGAILGALVGLGWRRLASDRRR